MTNQPAISAKRAGSFGPTRDRTMVAVPPAAGSGAGDAPPAFGADQSGPAATTLDRVSVDGRYALDRGVSDAPATGSSTGRRWYGRAARTGAGSSCVGHSTGGRGSSSGRRKGSGSGSGAGSTAAVASIATAGATDRREEAAAFRAGQSSVWNRRAAVDAVDRLRRHRDTSPRWFDRRRSPRQRVADDPSVAPVTRSAVGGPPERPLPDRLRDGPDGGAPGADTAARSRPTAHTKTSATTETSVAERVAVRHRARSPRDRPCRPEAIAHGDDDDGRGRAWDPEPGDDRHRMSQAGRDRRGECAGHAVAGEHDPSRRDGPDDLAGHPREDDGDDHVRRGLRDAQRRSASTRRGGVSTRHRSR